MRNRWLTTRAKSAEDYCGIPIHADEGVHERVAAIVKGSLPSSARILDVGAGAGALSKRLLDIGFDVTALDVDRSKWALPSVPFRVLDVDAGLAASIDAPFDALLCVEVIEHLENPWQFMRESFGCVRPGGYMILSTPNVTSFLSRLLFLRDGRFHQFQQRDLEYGHINPMTAFEIETAATAAGWRIVRVEPAGYLPMLDFSIVSIRAAITNVLRAISYFSARGDKRGWCLLFLMQKP